MVNVKRQNNKKKDYLFLVGKWALFYFALFFIFARIFLYDHDIDRWTDEPLEFCIFAILFTLTTAGISYWVICIWKKQQEDMAQFIMQLKKICYAASSIILFLSNVLFLMLLTD
ncbi:MAG: hypothetical protein LBL47_03495 [Lactobacillus sp.]|jgi:hypothetical protein|nr:hypothetical protein [Lactobacillus sp.]